MSVPFQTHVKIKKKQWILKEHTSFFSIDYMRSESASVRTWSAPPPHRRSLSKPRALGADSGCLWARRPVDWLLGAAGGNVLLFYFPAKMPVVLSERPDPHWHGNTTKPVDKAIWHCSESLPGCSKFIMVKEAEEKERAVVMHEYDGQYYYVFLKNEMMPPWRCFCACTQLQKIVFPQYVKLPKIN